MAITIDEKQAKFLERKPLIFFIYVQMFVVVFLYLQMQYERKAADEEKARLNGIILQLSKENGSTLHEVIDIYRGLNRDFSPEKYYENHSRSNSNNDSARRSW